MRGLRGGLCILCLALFGRLAHAEDPKSSSLSVLPWTGAFLQLGTQDRKFVGSLSSFLGRTPLFLEVQLSAPLDPDSRTAAFTTNLHLVSGFAGWLSLSYDSRHKALENAYLMNHFNEILAMCQERHISPCSSDQIMAKDISQYTMPRFQRQFYYSIGIDLAGSYDSVSAYGADLAADEKSYDKYSVQAGANLWAYWAPSLGVNLRAGLEVARGVRVADAQRCNSLMSSDPTISGQSCQSVNVLVAAPDPATEGYVRLSATYIFRHFIGDSTPGVEARLNFENIGQGATMDIRAAAFLSPRTGPVVTRFGLGVDLSYALENAPDGSYAAKTVRDIVPFATVGATL